ncbi:hypothetical protein ACFX12_006157 [Malus domestica]
MAFVALGCRPARDHPDILRISGSGRVSRGEINTDQLVSLEPSNEQRIRFGRPSLAMRALSGHQRTQPFKVVEVSELEKVGDVGNRKRRVEGGGSNNDSSRSHGGNKNL